MEPDKIVIKGAREHNLKNIDVEIPRNKLVVMTGVSGSGKSSLAFDTIFADGQRRYMESLSSYARMFMGQMEKPDVDEITGLSPAISIDQKTTSRNPRSTVGTVTEIYDYLRLLYARIGVPHCPVCGRVIEQQTVDQIVDAVLELPECTRFVVLSPIVRGRKGTHQHELEAASKAGFSRARIDGEIYDLGEVPVLDKNVKHSIEIVVDRLIIGHDITGRLSDSVETAVTNGGGLVIIYMPDDGKERLFSQNFSCPEHGISIDELNPRMFSFNNPFGACEKCSGLGIISSIDPSLVIPNLDLSIRKGAIHATGWNYSDGNIAQMYYNALAKKYKFSVDDPVSKISKEGFNAILYGTGKVKLDLVRKNEFGTANYTSEFEGVINNLERRYRETTSEWSRADLESLMSDNECPECHGQRLKPTSLAVTVGDKNIMDLCTMPVSDLLIFFDSLKLSQRNAIIAERLIKEIKDRLGFLVNVGLEYLTLSRAAATLSGGESQRIRLATQIGSYLMGVMYILDEPSIGLHQRDNLKLIGTLKRLRDIGNTVIVVEHDTETIQNADFIVDVGPAAGVQGGKIIFTGTPQELCDCPESITGQYLSGKKRIPIPNKRRKGTGKSISIKGAHQNNLKNIDVIFPLGTFICVTGVSGSGKSSLVNEILYKKLSSSLNGAKIRPGAFDEMTGLENVDKVIGIDQTPIGKTPRSNPATYVGLFNLIRDLFAETTDAKAHGYGPGRFSFNVKGGRCEACQGDGIVKIEMNFLPDVYVPCEVCGGNRYNRETLDVKYKGKSIFDVLEMTVDEALTFFDAQPNIRRKVQTLHDVGLSYIKLGQSSTTLSGGEAQRVKLASELSRPGTGRTVYILDEPTTGLSTSDVDQLIVVLQKLVDNGNTLIVIEHNLDVVKCADYIIDLGPEGGDRGGTVVVTGTPEKVANCPESYTGQYLKEVLKQEK